MPGTGLSMNALKFSTGMVACSSRAASSFFFESFSQKLGCGRPTGSLSAFLRAQSNWPLPTVRFSKFSQATAALILSADIPFLIM
ncbi:hypothetical protein STENM223S_00904 [Streptomyces tendae]